jgi:hypothetical protein
VDYEIALTARREAGKDSFCGLYFPIGDSQCTLAVGGYGGRWIGLANVDGRGATKNGTGRQMNFEPMRWYRIRLRVTEAKAQAWVDDRQVMDVSRAGRTFTPSLGDVPTKLALTTWETTAGVAEVKMWRLGPPEPGGEFGPWVDLFDGKSLGQWQAVAHFPDALHKKADGAGGQVRVDDGQILIEPGNPLSGITWRAPFPSIDYEVEVEARRVDQLNAFCNLIFPIGDSSSALYVGAKRGTMAGLFQVDGRFFLDGNVTTRERQFEHGRWYRVRLRVTDERVAAWVDDERLFSISRAAHVLGVAPRSAAPLLPFGVGTFNAGSALRAIRMRTRKPPDALPDKPGKWVSLFKPGALAGWQEAKGGRFAQHGRVHLVDETVVLEPGAPATGILCRRRFPAENYEVAFEVRRDRGLNHAHVLFPVGDSHCLLNLGGWEGDIVGLSLVDGQWAPGNGTAKRVLFQPAGRWRWYRVRLRVTKEKVEAWLDDEQVVDLARAGHTFAAANWPEGVMGFCLSNWESRSAFRNIKLRPLGPDAERAIVEQPGEWVSLFDGKTLDRWRVIERFPTVKPEEGEGVGAPAHVADGRIVLERGRPVSAIAWQGEFPRENYELSIEAMRVEGGCDFCNVAFPVGDSRTTLCVGTWPNRLELRYFDGRPVKVEDRRKTIDFKHNRWYRVGVRVTPASIRVTLDDETLIDLPRHGLRFYPSIHHAELQPFGVGTWDTKAAYRNIRVRSLGPGAEQAPIAELELPEPPKLPERPSDWFALFDGESLRGWKVVGGGDFAGHGQVAVAGEQLVLRRGLSRTGIAWRGDFPTMDYEVALELRRDAGHELCEILFPVGSQRCTWNIGGWGGAGTGVQFLDGISGEANDTFRRMAFRAGQWYRARLRVAEGRIECWLDDAKLIDLPTAGRKFVQPGWFPIPEPFGLAGWQTTLSLRHLRLRLLESQPEAPPAGGTKIKTASVAISARADWFDTGLFLAKGEPYELSAAGRWGGRASSSHGPEGTPRTWWGGYPHVGARAFDLIGRVGRHGRPFHVGGELKFTPAEAGQLYLRANDDLTADNWGSLRVQIAGPLVAQKDAPLLSRFKKAIAQMPLGPPRGWIDTGIELRRGDRLLVSADGLWGQGVDANGQDRTVNGQRAGALLARIGRWGARQAIGALHLLEADESGKLYLAVNDAARPVNRALRLLPGGALDLGALGRFLGGRGGPVAPAPKAEGALQPDGEKGALNVTIFAPPEFEQRGEEPEEATAPHGHPVATLRGHASWVISVAFSPDGTRLASGSRDHTVRLWDAATGECLKTLRGHTSTVECVAFSPDGKQVASAGKDKAIRLWDAATGEPIKALLGHIDGVRAVAFLRDGRRLASTGDDHRMLRIWDLATAQCVKSLPCDPGCWGLAVSPDGSEIAAASDAGWVGLWDAETGKRKQRFFAQVGKCWSLAYSPDGKRVLAAGDEPLMKVWEVATAKCLAALRAGDRIRAVAFSPDGKHIASGGWHRAVRLWDATTHDHLRSLDEHTGEVRGLAFSPDGKRLATASFDRTIKIWALEPRGAAQEEPALR